MISNSFREFLRAVGWVACAAWLSLGIYHEVFEQDPSQFGFRNPEVEAEMKNCISDDIKVRYECKEQAILANQRSMFLVAAGHFVVIFAPPILIWVIARRMLRLRAGDMPSRPPPSIQKWRVR